MARVQKDYEELLRLFNRHKVRYLVVGAFAVAFHSMPRYTKDLDLFIEASSQNARRVLAALKEFGFGGLKLCEKDFSEPKKIVQLGYEPVRIDIVTSIDGCEFRGVWNHRKKGAYGKVEAHFIGRDDLIRNKRASHRKQDQADVDILIKNRRRKK